MTPVNISRSEQKRQFKQVEQIAREIIELGDQDLAALGSGDELREAVSLCRVCKGGALKRQLKFVAKLLRSEDIEAILAFLSRRKGSKLEEERLFHEAERLRDAIITEAIESLEVFRMNEEPWPLNWQSATIDDALVRYPEINERELRTAVHQYARSRNRSCYRETFRIIRAAADKKRRSDQLESATGDTAGNEER